MPRNKGKTRRDRFVALAFCWADLLFEIAPDFTIMFAAGPTESFLDLTPDELVGRDMSDIVVAADVPILAALFETAQGAGRIDNETMRLKRPHDGAIFLMSLSGYRMEESGDNFLLGMKREIGLTTRSRPSPDESRLLDKAAFSEVASYRAKHLMATGRKTEITMLAVPRLGELDDHLDKGTRERLRHEMTLTLRAHSIAGDSVAEVGKGRFSLLRESDNNVQQLCAQIENIARSLFPAGLSAKTETASIALNGVDEISHKDLANGLLYAMNRFHEAQGEDFDIHVLNTNISALVASAIQEMTDFKTLLSESLFDVALQPIVDIATGEIHHYEALCRFRSPDGDRPYKYITFAEQTGMIHAFDLDMTAKVIDWLAHIAPINSSANYRVAVNVSGHSIASSAYTTGLSRLLRDNLWARGRLLFEITESSRIDDMDSAGAFIKNLRRDGFPVCLDDFGAGAASFQYMSSLDVDFVKLDGSAIRNAQQAHKGKAFLSALADLCRRLNVKTIAEMVDSPERLVFCRECGCDYVQGYLFGKPHFDIETFSPLPRADLFRSPH